MLLTIHWASVPRQTVISPSMSVCLSVFSTLWGWESTIPTPFISHKKIRQFRKSVFCLIRSFQINQLHLIASLYLVIPIRFLLFWFFLVIRIYTLFMHQMIHFGHFECGVNLFVEVIFCKLSGTCNSMHKLEWVVDTSPNNKAHVLPNISLYMNSWCHIELYWTLRVYCMHYRSQMWVMPFILLNSLVTAVMFVSSCIVSVGFRELCDSLTQDKPYQYYSRSVGQATGTWRYIYMYIFLIMKRCTHTSKPTFLHVGRVHNALLFRNTDTCNVKCRWFNNEFYTCKYFWAEVYILNNLLFDKDMY